MGQVKLSILLLVCIFNPWFAFPAMASTPRACGDDLQSTIGQMLPQLPAYANRAFNRRRPPQEPYTPTYVILAGNPEFEPLCRGTSGPGDGGTGRLGDGGTRGLGDWGTSGPGDFWTRGLGDFWTRGLGDFWTRRPGEFSPSPRLPVSLAPPPPVSLAPHLPVSLAPHLPVSLAPHLPVSLAPRPPLSWSPCPPSPLGTEAPQQAFITTLERQYTPNGVVFLQRFHWLFLTKTADGWELVQMFSIQKPTSGQPPTPPEESRDSFIGEAIRSWLQDCR